MAARPSEAQLKDLVRKTLEQLLSDPQRSAAVSPSVAASRRQVVDAEIVAQASPGSVLEVPPDALITPLARETALENKVTLASARPATVTRSTRAMTIAVGADHGGLSLKELLKPYLVTMGWEVLDCGTFGPESVDYPDFAFAVARAVVEGRAQWGILVDGAGIGSCMVANKVPGIRAALCYDLSSAANSREHNHANILTLGAGLIGPQLAQQIVKTWLETPFGTGRHARRVEKITQIERRFTRT